MSDWHFYFLVQYLGLPGWRGVVKNLGLISGLGRSPDEGNGNPLQYSVLDNPTGAWGNYSKWNHRVGHELVTKTATKTKQLWLFLGWTWPSQVHPVTVSMPSQKAQVCFCWPGRKQTAMLWAVCGGNQLTRTWGWPVVVERYPGWQAV